MDDNSRDDIDITDPLGEPCPQCGDPIGDHTVRRWTEHVKTPAIDLPVEEIPDGPIPGQVPRLVADHISTTSAIMDGGPLGPISGVIFQFSIGSLTEPPHDHEPVLMIGSPALIRKTGKLIRNICNQAANRAEKAAGR